MDELSQSDNIDIDKANVSISEEGTTLRIFYNKRWYTSTKSKLQAFKSNWADKSTTFGATFAQAVRNELGVPGDEKEDLEFLTDFYEEFLDKTKTYFFLLRSTEGERIVCDVLPQAKAIHICTQKNYINDFDSKINIGVGVFSHTFYVPNNLDNIRSVLDDLSYKNNQGVVIEYNNNFYKILLPRYQELADIRGSIASLRFCYLVLRPPSCYKERHLFVELYGREQEIDDLETFIFDMCLKLHTMYLAKYVFKHDTKLNGILSKALFVIHRRFIDDKIPTTAGKINDILTEYPKIVNNLLKVFWYKSKF
uniref:Putative immediate early ICP-46 n=1 Tax=Erythrocytic necrosis virus TaxID=1543320 RepID=A0A4D6QIT5_9VIRU|nr:putative immediate early ICP-46 [Erythrocytic necrosis virus]